MENAVPLFDARAAWAGMTAEQQAAIGIAAVIHAIGIVGEHLGRPPTQGFAAAAEAGGSALLAAIEDATGGDLGALTRPSLAPLDVTACRLCGCTEACACPGSCYWAEPDLCSRCADAIESVKARAGGVTPAAATAEDDDYGKPF